MTSTAIHSVFPHRCPRTLGLDCAICWYVIEKYSGREAISSMRSEVKGVDSEEVGTDALTRDGP